MSLTPAELYRLHARGLERAVAANVTTQNVQDAWSFAWMQMQLAIHGAELENPVGWLYTVATREALKLHRLSRRTVPVPVTEHGEPIELPDRTDRITAREQLIDAREAMRAAGLSDRQIRLLALQAIGLTYIEIAERASISRRTVERQLLRDNRLRCIRQGGES